MSDFAVEVDLSEAKEEALIALLVGQEIELQESMRTLAAMGIVERSSGEKRQPAAIRAFLSMDKKHDNELADLLGEFHSAY